MNPLVTAAVMAEIDRRTIEEIGIPGPVLMENAGRGTAAVIIETLEKRGLWGLGLPVAVISGLGNNGGDGFVVARYLREQGCHVTAFLVGRIEETQGDGRLNLDIYLKAGGEVKEITNGGGIEELTRSINDAEIVIDALFGTGLSKEVSGLHRQVIDAINAYGNMICSIDIPSGINASTGKIMGEAVDADFTCTFGLMKVGQAVPPGCSYCGDVHVLDIGIPEFAMDNLEVNNFLITTGGVKNLLPLRNWEFHKGRAGKVYVIGGSTGLTGAVVMACEGALTAGSGLIYAIVPESLNVIFEQKMTEQMTLPIPDRGAGCFSPDMVERVLELLKKADAIAIGPGLSHRVETEDFISLLLKKLERPSVIDADGLNCLSIKPDLLKEVDSPVIITPHEGEMSRLSGIPIEEVKENRLDVARDFSRRYGVITVLKGYRTVVADPEGTVYVNDAGNPYMATGGMGDILTGMVASFLGQGMVPIEATISGVYLHSLAADIAVESYPRVPVAPRQIISYYPNAISRIFGEESIKDGDLEPGE